MIPEVEGGWAVEDKGMKGEWRKNITKLMYKNGYKNYSEEDDVEEAKVARHPRNIPAMIVIFSLVLFVITIIFVCSNFLLNMIVA
ncbi:MAG: hypothetical protein HOB88_09515 [Bacteroidetes bacterium]|nr:hypothetical protein [Bacteroidota bacterium]